MIEATILSATQHRVTANVVKICARKFSVHIPKKYVESGKKASKVYDMGKHELR